MRLFLLHFVLLVNMVLLVKANVIRVLLVKEPQPHLKDFAQIKKARIVNNSGDRNASLDGVKYSLRPNFKVNRPPMEKQSDIYFFNMSDNSIIDLLNITNVNFFSKYIILVTDGESPTLLQSESLKRENIYNRKSGFNLKDTKPLAQLITDKSDEKGVFQVKNSSPSDFSMEKQTHKVNNDSKLIIPIQCNDHTSYGVALN